MIVYRISVFAPFHGTFFTWVESEERAKSGLDEVLESARGGAFFKRAENKRFVADIKGSWERVEVPTDNRDSLIEWLNENMQTADAKA